MAMATSAEQAELASLITQHLALSSVLNLTLPEAATSTIMWPPKPDPTKSSLTLATRPVKARLSNVNGSKLHTYLKKNAPYPLSYDQTVLDSDICDRITLRKLCHNGLTLHDFGDKAPDTVLDIGTGEGSWIIEAAATWQNASSLVGFDLVEIQPALSLNGPLGPLHERIKWVQGNALEKLPFDRNAFDFVRISRMALGVPENKWNHLIEEAVRVLKPEGVLEIIEEDIIFPYRQSSETPNTSIDFSSFSNSNTTSIQGDHDSSGSSAADHSTFVPPSNTRRPLSIMVPKTLSTRTRSRSLGSQSSSNAPAAVAMGVRNAIANAPVSAMPQANASISSYLPSLSTVEAEKSGVPLRDPKDHGILNQAWHAMLDDRFISPKPTSLLSLYLSFHLQSIRSHEPIQVVAPQSSTVINCHKPSFSPVEYDSYEIHLVPIDAAPVSAVSSRGSGLFTLRDAPMHLRRCLQVVLGCAEALWEQVKKAHPTMPRDYFDFILRDFELDMLDRIDTRSALKSSIGWDPRMDSSDLQKWRDRVSHFPRNEESEAPLVCRTIRGFVGTKPSS